MKFVCILLSGGLLLACLHADPSKKTITFSNYTWRIIDSPELRGPGPNRFSSNNVKIDKQGRLVLETRLDKGIWTSAQVFLTESLGYGLYTLELSAINREFDMQTVFGFFTWDEDPAYENREIDIEIARWGHTDGNNVHLAVQPWDGFSDRVNSFNIDYKSPIKMQFLWTQSKVIFSVENSPNASNKHTWEFPNIDTNLEAPFLVPPKGNEKISLNLWLFQGNSPNKSDRIRVERFTFIPID
jgi:hypothetical protein